MDKKAQRIMRLTQILRERNGASIKELALELNVSEMTVRRDLGLLGRDGIVSLVHGAAIYNSDANPGSLQRVYRVRHERTVDNLEKDKIGQAAAKLVRPGDTVILDIGTTTEKLARHIPMRAPIAVLCFTMNTLVEIQKREVERLLLGGGTYHPHTQLFESPETIELIRRTRATKLFLSAAGVSEAFGLTCINQYEVGIKRACIDSSLQKILMVSSGKFDQICPAYFASLDQVDTVITDSGLREEWRSLLRERDIELILAEREERL